MKRTIEEKGARLRRALQRRFYHRVIEGNFTNPFCPSRYCTRDIKRAMSEYYDMLLQNIPKYLQRGFWEKEVKENSR